MRRNEDAFITNLFSSAPDLGAPLIAANFPRCFVDVNRAPDELPSYWQTDGKIISPRAEIGMGVVPTMLSETINIYSAPLSLAAAKIRIKGLYHPYHGALQGLIDEARSLFGKALLIDCHSMPGFNSMGSRRSDIILGDRFGESCSPEIVTLIENLFHDLGYSVSRNYPYAGGFVTKYYGKPRESTNAIQIEVNRDLYLNPITLDKKPRFTALARDISLIINSIIKEVTLLNL